MEGLVLLFIIGAIVLAISNSGSGKKYKSQYPLNSSIASHPNLKSRSNGSSEFRVVAGGFQPTDRCSCGGSWVKRENIKNGGRFFSCSRYPSCTRTRIEVLKERLGSRYSDVYCSRGHEKAFFGTTLDVRSGKSLCKRCIDRGYIRGPQ